MPSNRTHRLIEGWLYKGITLNKLGILDDAIAAFDKVLILNPRHAQAAVRKGIVLVSLYRYDEAIVNPQSCS